LANETRPWEALKNGIVFFIYSYEPLLIESRSILQITKFSVDLFPVQGTAGQWKIKRWKNILKRRLSYIKQVWQNSRTWQIERQP